MLCADEWSAAWPGQAGRIVLPDYLRSSNAVASDGI